MLDEQKSQFDAKRNPTPDHCKYALFLLEEDGRPIGGIAAFFDLLIFYISGAEAIARDLKPIIQPKGVLFAEDTKGNTIGFAIALPNANVLLKGLNGRMA